MENFLDDISTLLSELLVQYPILAFTMIFSIFAIVIRYSSEIYGTNKRLVNQLEHTLSRFEMYGCSDAPRFKNCIHEEKSVEILTRYANLPNHKLRFEAQANGSANIEPGYHYEDSRIKRIAKLIDQATSGCCTTLAISAVDKLLDLIDNELLGHRVEMVSSTHGMGSHCFIIFDRAGDGDRELTGSNPNISAWGRNVLIIDPWAQSLGHGKGIYTLKNYPFKFYLTNLTQTYDSTVDHSKGMSSVKLL